MLYIALHRGQSSQPISLVELSFIFSTIYDNFSPVIRLLLSLLILWLRNEWDMDDGKIYEHFYRSVNNEYIQFVYSCWWFVSLFFHLFCIVHYFRLFLLLSHILILWRCQRHLYWFGLLLLLFLLNTAIWPRAHADIASRALFTHSEWSRFLSLSLLNEYTLVNDWTGRLTHVRDWER